MSALIALLAAIAATPPTSVPRISQMPNAPANTIYVTDLAPLKPSPLARIGIQDIRPQGWLKTELDNEATGFTGQLMDISSFLNPVNNAWLSPTGQGVNGWEEVPYWLRGYVDLAFVRRDPKMIAVARKWIEAMIASQQPDGWFGPANNKVLNSGAPDLWPNMLALQCLESWYRGTHDRRVLTLMKNYFRWELTVPDKVFLKSYWENMRAADNIASVYWLYNRLPIKAGGGPWMFDLVRKLHRNGADWVSGVVNLHGVNFAQSFREPAELSLLSLNSKELTATYTDLHDMRSEYGQVPGGMYGADENARPGFTDPRQATETCAMVEMMMSDEFLLEKTGDAFWGDHCEDVTFNDLPASMTPDEKALHYLTSPNMTQLDHHDKSPGIQNGGTMLDFDPHDFRCCQHNSGMGWPKYAEHLWMATASNGLAATLYAPNTVRAMVGNKTAVRIEEKTEYPFRDQIEFSVYPAKTSEFPLSFRVPEWCANPKLTINGKAAKVGSGNGSWLYLDRTWKRGDKVVLTLPMQITVHNWPDQKGGVSVRRGPLWYSLKIGNKYVRNGGTSTWPAYDVFATTPWNYGLDTSAPLKVKLLPNDPNKGTPFVETSSPIEIEAMGRQIPNWQLDQYGLTATLQPSPVQTKMPLTRLTLVPMGSARLRISVFPTVSTSASAHEWTAPRHPLPPIPAQASHVWDYDSVKALSTGYVPTSSDDQTVPRFTWWDHKGTSEWVEYDFTKPRQIDGSEVYWYDDGASNGGCRVPASWSIEAWVDGKWQPVHVTDGSYGTAKDAFNRVKFSQVQTSKLRITVKLQSGWSGGILQWKLLGPTSGLSQAKG